jgi:hypothetical protein
VSTILFASGIMAADSRGLLSGTLAEREIYATALEGILNVLNRIDLEMNEASQAWAQA